MQKDFIASEVMAEGLAYTVMGICIVFLILIIIMFVIKAMALLAAPEKKNEEPVSAVPASAEVQSEPEEDSLELVAVITAAVAAAMGTSAASIQVKSYKKLDGGAWNKAGRREVLENRF